MLQLHLFEPRDFYFDYKVIVTNKTESAKSVVLFHNGRGSQECIFGDAKNDAALGATISNPSLGGQESTIVSIYIKTNKILWDLNPCFSVNLLCDFLKTRYEEFLIQIAVFGKGKV